MDKNINSNKVGCLCIGAQKAGTTWLNQQLLRHPELYLPPIKETHYFDFLCSQKDRIWIKKLYQLRAKNRIQKLVKENEINWKDIAYYSRISALIDSEEVNEDWYHAIYSQCIDENILKMDITPAYLPMSITGVNEVFSYNSNMKLIVLLRQPVSRALSAARMMLKRKNIEHPTDEDWNLILKRGDIIGKSRYSRHLENWLHFFDKTQLLVVPYEKIAVAPLEIINEICDFLEISKMEQNNLFYERVHVGKNYPIPTQAHDWLKSRLANEVTTTKKMFPFLSDWWEE
jgi:hypothetical protein